jgi:hypothetical protein
MDFDLSQDTISRPAGADLRTSQYLFVKLNATGAVILCAAAGETGIGVLQNKPNTGEAAIVCVNGVSKVVCAVALNPQDFIATDAAGKAKAVTRLIQASGNASYVMGFIISPVITAANQIAAAFIQQMGIRPTADV